MAFLETPTSTQQTATCISLARTSSFGHLARSGKLERWGFNYRVEKLKQWERSRSVTPDFWHKTALPSLARPASEWLLACPNSLSKSKELASVQMFKEMCVFCCPQGYFERRVSKLFYMLVLILFFLIDILSMDWSTWKEAMGLCVLAHF